MTVERSQPGSSIASPQRADADGPSRTRREPPAAENVDRFRSLMQPRDGARQPAGDAARAPQGEAGNIWKPAHEMRGTEYEHAVSATAERGEQRGQGYRFTPPEELAPAETAALFQAQMTLRDGTPMPNTPVPQVSPSAFAEMVERHVRQMAISNRDAAGGDSQVLLRLSDDTLPGTDLLLTRTADGWLLRADVRSRSSYDAINRAGPELAERFASRNLGTLSFESHFHG